jgi:hypothetical protein
LRLFFYCFPQGLTGPVLAAVLSLTLLGLKITVSLISRLIGSVLAAILLVLAPILAMVFLLLSRGG